MEILARLIPSFLYLFCDNISNFQFLSKTFDLFCSNYYKNMKYYQNGDLKFQYMYIFELVFISSLYLRVGWQQSALRRAVPSTSCMLLVCTLGSFAATPRKQHRECSAGPSWSILQPDTYSAVSWKRFDCLCGEPAALSRTSHQRPTHMA